MTRWQGAKTEIELAPLALATARTAFGKPICLAISPYEIVFPKGMLNRSSSTFSENPYPQTATAHRMPCALPAKNSSSCRSAFSMTSDVPSSNSALSIRFQSYVTSVAVFLHLPVAQTELVAQKRTEHQYSAWRFITFYLNDILLFSLIAFIHIFYTVCNLSLRHHLHYRTTLCFSTTVFWHCMKACTQCL